MSVDLDEVLAAAAVDPTRVVVGRSVDTVPPAPSHRWIVFPSSRGGVVIGGSDRGTFAPYAELSTSDGAADALRELMEEPLAPPPPAPMKALVRATQTLADQLRPRLEEAGALSGDVVPEGALLDHIGPECGHVLYLLNTPMSQRSLPPTDLEETRCGYVVQGPLPAEAVVETVPPWFGQPGGGVVVRLPQVIRWYVDSGLLARFDPTLEP